MIRNKLLYAVLLVILLLFLILYRGKLSLEVLIFAVVFPVFPLIALIRIKSSVSVSLRHNKENIRRGESFYWILQVQNDSLFSSANATADVEYRSSMDGRMRKMKISLPVLPRNVQRIRLNFHTATCGVMELRVTRMDIYDPLRLFHRKKRFRVRDAVTVMPSTVPVLPPDWAPQPKPDADASEYSKYKPGDDPSEIFDLHAYREGDPVSRIHWKLSSKLDTLMIKEYSLPLSDDCTLLADYRLTGEMPEAAFRTDLMMSALTTAADTLAHRGVRCKMALYHAGTGIGLTDPMKEPGECFQWIAGMVQSAPVPETEGSAFLTELAELLCGAHVHDRLMLFIPRMTPELEELLLSVPNPERITVFAVMLPEEAGAIHEEQTPYPLFPVLLDTQACLTAGEARPEEGGEDDA
ncbi:MAG: DUF58 domain-containing protein [Oscillospiraceae bacterium]|nr:DUF58 domain-containing protein [Oscillospiraceae bacterium]